MFVSDDGKNVLFTFILVSSLFLLWGFCNGMIDVMDKHFQDGAAPQQGAVGLGAIRPLSGLFPDGAARGMAGVQARLQGRHHRRAVDGRRRAGSGSCRPPINDSTRRFLPRAFSCWRVCTIAAGLTFLETIANPYTTVLGPKQYAATRINLAQSCNGIGWIFGPIIGGVFFYCKDAAGNSTGSQTLYIPYATVARGRHRPRDHFLLCHVPDIKTEDDYHLDDSTPGARTPSGRTRTS